MLSQNDLDDEPAWQKTYAKQARLLAKKGDSKVELPKTVENAPDTVGTARAKHAPSAVQSHKVPALSPEQKHEQQSGTSRTTQSRKVPVSSPGRKREQLNQVQALMRHGDPLPFTVSPRDHSNEAHPSKKSTVRAPSTTTPVRYESQGQLKTATSVTSRMVAEQNNIRDLTDSVAQLDMRPITPPPKYKQTTSPPPSSSRRARHYHGSSLSSRPPTPPTPTGPIFYPPAVSSRQHHKYYVVTCGRRTGVFTSWNYVKSLVDRIPGGAQQCFRDEEEANRVYNEMKAAGLVSVMRTSATDSLLFGPRELAIQ